MTEKPQGSPSLIHISSVGPAGWGFAWSLFFSGREEREREREREREAVWVGGGGMWLEKTAGCLPTGTDAAAGAVVREHTCHSVRLTLFSLLVSMWIMDSARIHCQDVILYSMLPHMLTLAVQTGSQWEFCFIKVTWRIQSFPHTDSDRSSFIVSLIS